MRELGFNDEVGRLGESKGLIEVYAYHCYKCNYTWLPRDFDFLWSIGKKCGHPEQENFGEDLLHREPPKSCARCKSKYWKEMVPLRNLRRNHFLNEEEWFQVYGYRQAWTANKARLRALDKHGKFTPKGVLQIGSEER